MKSASCQYYHDYLQGNIYHWCKYLRRRSEGPSHQNQESDQHHLLWSRGYLRNHHGHHHWTRNFSKNHLQKFLIHGGLKDWYEIAFTEILDISFVIRAGAERLSKWTNYWNYLKAHFSCYDCVLCRHLTKTLILLRWYGTVMMQVFGFHVFD